MNKEIKRIIVVLVGLCLSFISLMAYISYFQVFKAEGVKNNSYNKRLWINEEKVLRGSILDRNHKVLAYSEKNGETYNRLYPHENLYSHIIGYSYREYGKAGLELEFNNPLLNINSNQAINEIKNLVAPSTVGNNLRLTIDHGLQNKTRELLKNKKGSIVTMDPRTGEILSLVSMPDFNARDLKNQWKNISEDINSPLLNRATQGLYAPGSTFKIISAIAILNSEINEEFKCTGSINIDGYIFKDYNEKAHGNIDLKTALAKSCNTYFAQKSIEIGKESIGNIAERFLINTKIPFDLPVKNSQFNYRDNIGSTDLAAASIGQGKLLVTPLNMALIASGIANNGEIMKPILVKNILSPDDKVIKSYTPEILSNATDGIKADLIKEMMVETVKSGTGTNAKIKNVKVAGKTGTAETGSGKSHAWFIGFAPADNPKVAVAVVLEEEGSTGGSTAAPIGRDVIIYALNNIKN